MADHGNGGEGQEMEYSDQPFYWWYGSDLVDFFATVAKYGLDNIYIELRKEKGEKEVWLDVRLRDSGGQLVGHYDASHLCPPDCSE